MRWSGSFFAAVMTLHAAVASASPPSSQPSSQPSGRTARLTAADLLTPAQLQQKEQALGWWLGGSGGIGLAAGGLAMWVASRSPPGRAHDLERGAGVTFLGLGAALLVAGIYIMAGKDPGPCETDGTALRF